MQTAQFPSGYDFSEKLMNVLLFASNFYLMGKKHPEPQYWCQMVSVCTVRCLTVCLCCFLQVSQLDWRSRIITLEIQKLCMTVYSLRLTVLTPVPDISSSWSTFVKHPGRTDCHTRDQHVNLWPAQTLRHQNLSAIAIQHIYLCVCGHILHVWFFLRFASLKVSIL